MFCENCDKRGNCVKICGELERYLQRKGSDKDLLGIDRLYSDSWIKLKEVPVDPTIIDVRALEPRDGEKKIKKGDD